MMRIRRLSILALAAMAVAVTLRVAAMRAQVLPTRVAAVTAADLRAWDTAVDRMAGTGELRARASTDDTLVAGRVHDRFDQYYQGVRVYGGDIARQSERGLTVSIFGTVYSGLSLDVTPGLSRDNMIGVVERLSGVRIGGDRLPELLILPDEAGGYRLVYRARVFTQDDGIEYFLDALSGAVVRQLSAAERQTSALGRGQGVLGDAKKISVASQSGAFVATDLLRPPSLRTYGMRGNTQNILNSRTASDRSPPRASRRA